ncbi:MAG: hypothetical protein WA667_24270 [Candidatus Nitrosopolaris sp.]
MADSIYYYKPGGFKQYFRTITDQSLLVLDALAGFKEIKCLPKRFKELTIQQVSDDPKLIAEIQQALRDGMQPESKYKLPYDKEERQKEIIDSIAEVFDIDRKNTQCKVVTGIYKDDKTGQQFPYAVEIAIAPRKDLGVDNAGEVTFIGSVNDTPAIDGGERYFQSDLYVYKWTDRRGEHYKNTAKEVLAEFGFNTYWGTSRRRVPSVVLINVKTSVPDWLGAAGKTHINQVPYGETIARTLCTMSHNIPSYRGQGYATLYESSFSAQKSAEDYLDDFLIDRRKEIEADPSLRITDRLTQRGSWYRVRPIMVADGFQPRKNWGITGESFAANIRQHCKQLWTEENITREYLGIFAKARGMFYYKGEKYPIEFNAIEELASKAAFNIVIEKEGVPAVLEPYADKYGVALINSQGRFVDYVKDFVRAAMKDSSIVVTLLDDDKVGHDMAESTDAIKIGVSKDTVLWLQQNGYPDLRLEDVQEEYSPDGGYTRDYRIEIDAILAEVKAEGLWKYIMHKLKELAPFDLTKAIDMPSNEELYPPEVQGILSYFNEYKNKILKDESQQIELELGQASELTDIKAKQDEIQQRQAAIIAKDSGMQLLQQKLGELLKELRNAGR